MRALPPWNTNSRASRPCPRRSLLSASSDVCRSLLYHALVYALSMSDPLLRFRPEFPILSRTNYMISNSLGAMPRGAGTALAEYADTWQTRGVRAWEEKWWDLAREVGDEIGILMNASPNSVSTFQ